MLRDYLWKQPARFTTAKLEDQLQLIHDEIFDLHDQLPVPCSFLIDERGRLSVIVLAMGLKPSPLGESFRFLYWRYGKLSNRFSQSL